MAFTFAGVATLVISLSRDINHSIAFIAADVVVTTANLAVSWSTSRAPTHPFDSPRSVPPGYQFSTPSTLETPPSHSDPTLYMPSQHHHPVFQPVFGIPPTEPPTTLDHHTMRPSPTWFDAILLALHGLQLATLNLPGQLQRQRFHNKYLNITNLHNLQLHLFQPRHHHLLQARHLQHHLYNHRPRPNGLQALLPETEETSPQQDLKDLSHPAPSGSPIFTTTCTSSTATDAYTSFS